MSGAAGLGTEVMNRGQQHITSVGSPPQADGGNGAADVSALMREAIVQAIEATKPAAQGIARGAAGELQGDALTVSASAATASGEVTAPSLSANSLSVAVLFHSVAKQCGVNAVGVILTGIGCIVIARMQPAE